MSKLYIAFFVIILVSCNTSKTANKINEIDENTADSTLRETLEENMNCEPNANDTFILCSSYEIKDRVKYLKVVIYELATNEIIYEPNKRIRKVSWLSEYEVKVDLMIGTPSDAADSDYVIYNVKTKSMKKSSIK